MISNLVMSNKNSFLNVLKKQLISLNKKKPLSLVLPYLRFTSLQPRNKLQNFMKKVLNCRKLQVNFQKPQYTL